MTRELKTVRDFAASGPFSESQLRWWIFEAERNGLAKCGGVIRIRRRVYLDPAGFDRWVESQQKGATA